MLRRSVILFACLTLATIGGCGSEMKSLSKSPWIAKTAKWQELDNLYNGPSGNLQRAFRTSGAVQAVAPTWFTDAQFVESLQKFEATPIPSEFANPERDQLKTEIVTRIKKLQATPGRPTKETAREIRQLKYAYDRLVFIPGQTPPTGSEAAQYSAVIPPVEPVPPVEPGAKPAEKS